MGTDSHQPNNSSMGQGTPNTDSDLGHRPDGDTNPLPASNEPLAPGVKADELEQGDENSSAHHAPLDDGLRPTGGNS